MPSEGVNIRWEEVCRQLVHPTKFQIIEALACAGRPVSPSELHAELVKADPTQTLQRVNYHVISLAEAEIATTAYVGASGTRNPEKTYYELATRARA